MKMVKKFFLVPESNYKQYIESGIHKNQDVADSNSNIKTDVLCAESNVHTPQNEKIETLNAEVINHKDTPGLERINDNKGTQSLETPLNQGGGRDEYTKEKGPPPPPGLPPVKRKKRMLPWINL